MMVAIAAAMACGDSSTGLESVDGTYTLRSINGTTLPYTVFQSGTTRIEVTDDVMVLNSNGTYTESGHTRNTAGTQVTTLPGSDAGTYTTSGTSITLHSNDGTTSVGTVSGGTLTIVDAGLSAVFTR